MLDRVVWDVYSRWRVGELLQRHPGLRIAPSRDDSLHFHGTLEFHLQGPKGDPIHDKYEIQFVVPPKFPAALPRALETGARIPPSFHHFVDGSLCLGAPTELRLRLDQSPNLTTYVDEFLVPYLFGHAYFQLYGQLPFGELAHGDAGIAEYLCGLLGANDSEAARKLLRLAALKRRDANKLACPCGSGRRLEHCHNQEVDELRAQHGRRWCRNEHSKVRRELSSASQVD
jgi:hypothetical protein